MLKLYTGAVDDISDIVHAVARRLNTTRDVEFYKWVRARWPDLNVTLIDERAISDNTVEYIAWLLSIGYPDYLVEHRAYDWSNLRFLSKGSSFDQPFVENALMQLPIKAQRGDTDRAWSLGKYLSKETDYKAGAERLARWGYVGNLAYLILENVARLGNWPFVMKLIDDLPSTKTKGYTPTQVKHIRRVLDLLKTKPALSAYPPLIKQIELWKPRGK